MSTGAQGQQGIQGVQGQQGIQGPSGAQGQQGIQGVQGVQGIQGPTGLQGPRGRAGGPTGPGFNAILSPSNFSILTATGTSTNTAVANSNLTWNGSVLNVVGDISASRIIPNSGSVSAPSYTFLGDLSMGLYDPSSNVLGFVTSGVERMRIANNGNVGIGSATPVSTLVVHNSGNAASGGSNNYALVINQGTSETSGQASGILFTQGYSNGNQGGASIRYITSNIGFGKGDLAFFLKKGFSGISGEDAFEAIRIKSVTDTPLVGIGRSDPQYTLDVSGSVGIRTELHVNTSTNAGMKIFNPAGSTSYFQFGSNTNATSEAAGRNLSFGPIFSTTPWLFIQSNGNVGINCNAPVYRFDVNGTVGRINNMIIGDVGHGSSYVGLVSTSNYAAGTANYALLQGNSGTDLSSTFLNGPTGGQIYFRIANQNRMFLNSLGRFGINTTDPQYLLDVNGDARVSGRLIFSTQTI